MKEISYGILGPILGLFVVHPCPIAPFIFPLVEGAATPMNIQCLPFTKQPLALATAIAITLVSMQTTLAGQLVPGESATVTDQSPIEEWSMSGAELNVSNNGQTDMVYARRGSAVNVGGGKIIASSGIALHLVDSEATLNNAQISSTNGYGIAAIVDRTGLLNGSKVTATDSIVTGVGRGISATFNSDITLSNTKIMGSGSGVGDGLEGGVGMTLFGATAKLVNGSNVTGDNRGIVMASDQFANSNKVTLNVDGSTVAGKNGSAILVTDGATPDTRAEINISNGATLTGGNGIILEIEKASAANFNVNNSHLVGDVVVEAGSTANLDLQNSASLTGTITNATSLTIDKSSLWVMEDNSTVGKLNLKGGMVNLRGTDGNASFHQLDVEQLTGSGTFGLGTDLAAGAGDSLNVSGTATGNHKLLVENTGAEPQAGGADRQLVHIDNGDAQFAVDSADGMVDAGAYSYALEQRPGSATGNDWFLVQTGSVSKSTEVAIGLFSAAPTVWYGESATLRSRMGELRTDSNQGGGWLRTYGNKHNMSAAGGIEYSQQQQGISFGADLPVSSSNGQWLVGVMGGYSKSDLDLKAANKGKVDSYYVGAYSTWLADNGFYIDALIKANRFQNSADVTMRDGVKSKGDYNNYGVGASVEAGKHITFSDGWFVEPYAQVSGLWVSGEDYKLDNGLEASSNKADSLLGKVGSHLGRKFALDDGGFVQPYIKAAVAREFVTSNKVKVNESRFTNDLSGTRGEFGLGVAAQLTDVLQVHAGFDYMKGQNIEQPWGVNVGVRYNW